MDAEFGPLSMPAEERKTTERILLEIFGNEASDGRAFIQTLLRQRTWANVYDVVRAFDRGVSVGCPGGRVLKSRWSFGAKVSATLHVCTCVPGQR